MNVYDRFFSIKGIVLDIDGVCTDNSILVTDQSEFFRMMNVRDGYAIKKALLEGFKIGIISGGKSEGSRRRFELLGVTDIYLGIENKLEVFLGLLEQWQLSADQIAYMGDDIPDLEVMQEVGLASCPSDAVPEILKIAKYVSPIAGGQGCVRDLLEKILQAQEKWL
ncbi:MAG: HAD-IIIA family hydrolase [Saprospiraceae bacterium]|nr:HAD-IIIA family hydrolase [Saprospiraceae bacterium]